MKRQVFWYQIAAEGIAQLAARNPKQATRILVATREFGNGGRGDTKKLQGSDEWRLRVGNWRVLFVLHGDAMYISSISGRQDAY
ncbi:MAG: hypothetical protein M5U18_08645 [Dehalococcoidia bacterium]|nr:hypothetical protein [Dehalococcoidia bacterium]